MDKIKINCIFCDFIGGKKKRNKDYPFEIIHETKNTLSFLSIDFPKKEDGHMLVIPKKHFKYLEEIPKEILHEIIEHIKLASRVLKKTHKGCNIWTNNGKAAQQSIFHVHFHIVPRDTKDGIKIRIWEKKKMSKKEFEKLNLRIKKGFDSFRRTL